MINFRIYYDGGQTFEGRPEDAPKYGVICILQDRGDQRGQITSGTPYYMWNGKGWLPCWENDLVDYLVHKPEAIGPVIIGRIVDKAEFIKVFEQAKADRAEKMD